MLMFSSKVAEKLANQDNCVPYHQDVDFSCVERYIEKQIQCKLPWSFTENDQSK